MQEPPFGYFRYLHSDESATMAMLFIHFSVPGDSPNNPHCFVKRTFVLSPPDTKTMT